MPNDELAFQSGKEALGHRVVVRINDRFGGGAQTHFLAAVANGRTDAVPGTGAPVTGWCVWHDGARLAIAGQSSTPLNHPRNMSPH